MQNTHWPLRVRQGLLGLAALACIGMGALAMAEPAAVETAAQAPATGLSNINEQLYLLFTFTLAIFLGVELIAKVPSQLHTPLMSGSNAISGITIVGALLAAGHAEASWMVKILGMIAVVCATINVVGGYVVTDRMLGMFVHKDKKA